MTTTLHIVESRRTAIRRIFASQGGAMPIAELAQRVLRSGLLREDERDLAVLRWVKEECRKALTEDDPKTGLPFAGESTEAAPPDAEDAGRTIRVFKQLDLWTFDEFAHNVAMKVQSITADRRRLHRLLRWGRDKFGRIPTLPPWVVLDEDA